MRRAPLDLSPTAVALRLARGVLLGLLLGIPAFVLYMGAAAMAGLGDSCADTAFEMRAFGATQLARAQEEDGEVRLSWTQVAFATGYSISRRQGEGAWEQVADVEGAECLAYADTAQLQSGAVYSYRVAALCEGGRSEDSNAMDVRIADLSSPGIGVARDGGLLALAWGKVARATGYEVEYATNSLLLGKQAFSAAADEDGRSIPDADMGAEYFARVRAVQEGGGETKYSDWTYSDNVAGERHGGLDPVRQNGDALELRQAIGEAAGGFSIAQGSASDGQFIYCALHSAANSSETKIAKVNAADGAVAGVSQPLQVGHANDLTFDGARGQLAVCHLDGGNPLAVSYVDPNSLTLVETREVAVPDTVDGANDEQRAGIANGIQAIAWQGQSGHYFALVHAHDFIECDADLRVVRYIATDEKSVQTSQGMEMAGDRILLSYSGGSGYGNIIQSFTANGHYLSQVVLDRSDELESCFTVGNVLYATFYGGSSSRTCRIFRVENC